MSREVGQYRVGELRTARFEQTGGPQLAACLFGNTELAHRQRTASTKAGCHPMIKRINRGESMTEPTYEELKARLADLEKQVETKKRSGAIEFRVSEKGGVSVYGLGRFPVTLYYEQWTKLLNAVSDLKVFIEENKSKLKMKEG